MGLGIGGNIGAPSGAVVETESIYLPHSISINEAPASIEYRGGMKVGHGILGVIDTLRYNARLQRSFAAVEEV